MVCGDLSVTGIIEASGLRRHVTLPASLLVQDGWLFAGNLASRYLDEADAAEKSRDFKAAQSLRRLGQRVLDASAGLLERSGCPVFDARLALRPLMLCPECQYAWVDALQEVGAPASPESPVSFRVSEEKIEVAPELGWVAEYCMVPCEVLEPVQAYV
ncbi:MAG: hypothetical protein JSS66_06105 [Armatimonadetes bacterium]|nr:hypothetical protein [Armatimonadota bacterium]